MSTVAIVACAICALVGWCALVQAAREVLVARARPPACPCQDLDSLTIPTGGMVVTRFSTEGVTGVERAAREVH